MRTAVGFIGLALEPVLQNKQTIIA